MIILEETNIIDDVVESILENFAGFFRGFNFVCYNIFLYGNLILFLFYLVLGRYLLVRAKNVEDKQKIYGRNLEFIKKRGRISAVILMSVAVLYLFKALPLLLLWLGQSFPLPPFVIWLGGGEVQDALNSIITIKDLLSYDDITISFIFFIGLMSFISVMLISFGVFLAVYNKSILRTKNKPISLILLGIILSIVFGFTTYIRLII
jgi:hypothetical protein